MISLGAPRGKALAARPFCQEQPFTQSRYFCSDSCGGDKTIGSADWHLAITLLPAVFAIAGNVSMITFDRHLAHRIADLLGRLKQRHSVCAMRFWSMRDEELIASWVVRSGGRR